MAKISVDGKAHLRAAKRAEKMTKDGVLVDLVFLLDQLGTIEHAQDSKGIDTVRRRYGWQRT